MRMRGKLTWHGDEVKRAARRGSVDGLRDLAQSVFDASQELVPVAPADSRGSGYLKESGTVELDEVKLRAVISYSSPPRRKDGRSAGGAGLAIWVHENLTTQHAEGKSAKYLEAPLNEAKASGAVTRIAGRALRRELK